MFSLIYPGPHGDTVESDNPKLDAYKQASYVANILRHNYSITSHEDGAYTVHADGLAAITFNRSK